ncbi:GFA family protein [Comamonas odontotermitis]|uniref:GFA family protein n=1 Tax=Comamonas odontotermitis TaxID=379895 RepID=UPI001CC4FE9C|nr:GFA family protein [Comamonas odontotermitis]UBB18803.1 GFA family protein [Comamonas odontotermitis]
MHIHGSCHCGAIRFTADIDPERVTLCHCSDCQALSGAPMRAIVRAPIDQFQLQGNPKAYVKTAQSGQRRAQVFCPECGTPLYGSEALNPQYVVIRLGCVAERAGLPPRKQIWTRSAMPWIHDLENVPAFAEGS